MPVKSFEEVLDMLKVKIHVHPDTCEYVIVHRKSNKPLLDKEGNYFSYKKYTDLDELIADFEQHLIDKRVLTKKVTYWQ